jgi:hypothetical protein
MNLREEMTAIRFGATEEGGPWLRAAAVLAQFNPVTLMSEAGLLDPASPQMQALMAASQRLTTGRRLSPEARRAALAQLATRPAMRAARALNPGEGGAIQAAFDALIGEGPVVGAEAAALAGLAEALTWVTGILSDLPDPAEVAARLNRARLLAPFRKLVGDHFAGREDVLGALALHLYGADASKVLMLQGPGGVGKSTVLAKFILSELETDATPPTVIMLNLDNPELVIDDPFTLIQEAGRQLRAQHPQMGPALDEMGAYIASLQRRSRGVEAFASLSGAFVDWSQISEIAAQTIALVPGDRPILLVIDTFEEAQFTGPSAVSRLMQLVDSLRAGSPRLKVVLAGRVEAPGAQERAVQITALDPSSAGAVLQAVAGLGPLPQAVRDAVFAVTGGNPLSTKLAGRVLAAEGLGAFDADRAGVLGRMRDEQVQSRLYGRVLEHIHDPVIRRLAYPGLAVRRITPAVLQEVLARPCHVDIPNEAEAQRLFDLFAAEVALVERDPSDGSLRHRQDVRHIMLDDLRRDKVDTVAVIDAAAISYWRGQPGVLARAEEIYHLLITEADVADLDQRWEPGVEAYLSASLSELPPVAQVYLSTKLQLDLRPDLVAEADISQWEVNSERIARNYMRDGLASEALSVLNQRKDRNPGTKLYLTEAEALVMLGQKAPALQVITLGLRDAEASGERVRAVLLRLLQSLIHESEGRLSRAGQAAGQAWRQALRIDNAVLRLRVISVLLRLHRKSLTVPGPAPEDLVTAARDLVQYIGLNSLFDTPGLLRELAAEVGPRIEGLIHFALTVTGGFIQLPPQTVTSPPQGPVLRRRSDAGLAAFRAQLLTRIGTRVNAQALLSDAVMESQKRLAEALVADLLAAEVDSQAGWMPSQRMLGRRKAWREVNVAELRAMERRQRAA